MSERMTRLKAPPGIVGVQYGGETFRVVNGHVVVPAMAEAALTRPGMGFKFPEEPLLVYADPELKVVKRGRG